MPVLLLETDGLLVPYFIAEEGLRFKSGESVIAKLDWVNSDKKAKEICGLAVYVREEDVENSEDGFYPEDLVGFKLFEQSLGFIGEITDVTNYSGNILITVYYNGKECLVPFNEDLLTRLDEDLREIEMNLPEGIFDLDEE
jgi:16S rRNA processing protein RimM